MRPPLRLSGRAGSVACASGVEAVSSARETVRARDRHTKERPHKISVPVRYNSCVCVLDGKEYGIIEVWKHVFLSVNRIGRCCIVPSAGPALSAHGARAGPRN